MLYWYGAVPRVALKATTESALVNVVMMFVAEPIVKVSLTRTVTATTAVSPALSVAIT